MLRLIRRFLDLFHRDERLIFSYWDGRKTRYADPFVVWRALWTSGDFLADIKTSANPLHEDGSPFYPVEQVFEAEDRLRNLIRHVFGVEAWTEDSPGLTVEETDKLLETFLAFCEDVKKKHKVSPISSPPSTLPEPAGLPDVLAFPAGCSSDYPSMPNESNAVEPTGT